MDDLIERMQAVWSEVDEAGGSIDECWAGVRDLVLDEAAKVAETTYAKDAFRFELGTSIAAAIRSLSSKGGGVMAELRGFIIANRGWIDDQKLAMGAHTFGRTAAEAWRRHIDMRHRDRLDFSVLVQRWSDKGWGPHEVSLSLAVSRTEAEAE